MVKNLPANSGGARDAVRSLGWEDALTLRNGSRLQSSCLENPMDRGAWRAPVHGVTESDLTERVHTHTHTHTN